MKELLSLLCNYLDQGRPVVLASVIAHQGSTPRGAGSRLLADKNGLVAGSIGGGWAEGQVLEACRAALCEGRAKVMDFTLNGELAANSGMICGGSMRVLVEPLLFPAESLQFFQGLRAALNENGAVLITEITDTSRPLRAACIGSVRLGAPLPEDAVEELIASVLPGRETAVHTRCDGRSYFIECCFPSLRMLIAGGGHVARHTAQVGALVGFEVSVFDDRPEFSQPERFPWAGNVAAVPGYLNCFAEYAPDSRTYIVIVTRGHLHDAVVLSQALATKAGYIGMIGSRRKRDALYAALRSQGVSAEAIARVHCPVGLPIGAETPEEIAVSIVAECIAHRRKAR